MASLEKISIIIPAYNEVKVLRKNLEIILQNFPDAEVILVDDGSRDKTADIFQKKFPHIKYIRLSKNKGKGFAIRKGMLEANGDYLIFSDADLPFGVDGVREIVKSLILQDNQVVIAEKTNYKKGFLYLLVRKCVRKISSIMFRLSFNDTQAGLKGFTREAGEYIFQNTFINRFACDVEMLFLAQRGGLKVKSIPLSVQTDPKRLSHFKFKEGLIFVYDIFKIRIHKYGCGKILLCEKESEKI